MVLLYAILNGPVVCHFKGDQLNVRPRRTSHTKGMCVANQKDAMLNIGVTANSYMPRDFNNDEKNVFTILKCLSCKKDLTVINVKIINTVRSYEA